MFIMQPFFVYTCELKCQDIEWVYYVEETPGLGAAAPNKKQGVSGQSMAVSRDLKVMKGGWWMMKKNNTSCIKTGGKAQQGLPLSYCDQGGADGEWLPQESLSESGKGGTAIRRSIEF